MDREIAVKLAKLLRMLTSSHDNEVLVAASKINGIVAAHDIDWDAALSGSTVDLTREQMERIFEAGRQKGLEEASRREPDWSPVESTSQVGGRLPEIEKVLDAAERARLNGKLAPFERSFTSSMRDRIDEYGAATFVSEKQWAVFRRLRLKLENEGFL